LLQEAAALHTKMTSLAAVDSTTMAEAIGAAKAQLEIGTEVDSPDTIRIGGATRCPSLLN
jgi:hypothetical protein